MQIEESPFSEEFEVSLDSGRTVWIMEGDGIAFEYVFDNGRVETDPAKYMFEPMEEGGVVKISGYFDESVKVDEGTKRTVPVPRLVVWKWPLGTPVNAKVEVRGKSYKFVKREVDANIGMVIWLA
jgi:hypothetical protein